MKYVILYSQLRDKVVICMSLKGIILILMEQIGEWAKCPNMTFESQKVNVYIMNKFANV